ncbi:MAG: glutaminase [Saprospiraceae bacterium]|nr:glutaminase [Saprospiraceae bacterium]
MLTSLRTKRLECAVQTCGFYDEAGEFTFRVGLPGKKRSRRWDTCHTPPTIQCGGLEPTTSILKFTIKKRYETLELLTTYSGSSIF